MIVKTRSEVQYRIIEAEVDGRNGVVGIWVEAKNPYNNPCSVKEMLFCLDGVWYPATAYAEQEEDFGLVPLTGRMKRIRLNWDAAKDLRIMRAWENISVMVRLNDRAYLAGVDAEPQYYRISLIDFRVREVRRVVFPYSNDPYFDFMFVNKKTCRPALMHFRLEVATDKNFANIVKVFDTREDQTGWQCDGGAFPEHGITGDVEHEILLVSAEMSGLSEGEYFIRITPFVTQFYVRITMPVDGQVYIGGQVDIEGEVVVVDD